MSFWGRLRGWGCRLGVGVRDVVSMSCWSRLEVSDMVDVSIKLLLLSSIS